MDRHLFEVGDDAVVGELAAKLIGDVEDVHEPAAVRGDVGLLDGKIEVGEDLDGLEEDSMLPGAVHLGLIAITHRQGELCYSFCSIEQKEKKKDGLERKLSFGLP